MKKKLLFACIPFFSLAVAAAVLAFAVFTGWKLVAALALVVLASLVSFFLYQRAVFSAVRPVDRIRSTLEHVRRLGIPVPRSAEDQLDELFKDLDQAFDHILRSNADLEWKVRRRREELDASETQLRRTNAFLDSIVENVPNMIFVKDARELRFVLFNRAGEELLGYPRKDLIGKNDYDFFPKSEADFFTAKDRQVLNRGRAVIIEEEPIHTKFGTRVLYTKKVPLLDADGRPQYLLGISEDITARKQNEAKLVERTKQLERAQIEKDQMELFSYVAAHDLREPAHKIHSFGDLLAEYLPAEGPPREYLTRMQNAADRMGRLIDDLLKFSKMTRQEVQKQPLQLEPLLREVVQDFDLLIANTRARISVSPLPVVDCGVVQIQELFRNLVGNALKFRHPDRTPEIAVSAERQPDGGVDICVQDNGIGFEQIYAERIFRPFERLHSRRDYEGTGIGLAICVKIAEQIGATLSATGRPGEGATFKIHFPPESVRGTAPVPASAAESHA